MLNKILRFLFRVVNKYLKKMKNCLTLKFDMNSTQKSKRMEDYSCQVHWAKERKSAKSKKLILKLRWLNALLKGRAFLFISSKFKNYNFKQLFQKHRAVDASDITKRINLTLVISSYYSFMKYESDSSLFFEIFYHF